MTLTPEELRKVNESVENARPLIERIALLEAELESVKKERASMDDIEGYVKAEEFNDLHDLYTSCRAELASVKAKLAIVKEALTEKCNHVGAGTWKADECEFCAIIAEIGEKT